MDHRQPPDARALAMMVLLCLVWSGQQIVLKAVAADFAPIFQIGLRCGLSALLVLALMAWRAEPLVRGPGIAGAALVAGLLFALEFVLVGESLRLTYAAHVVVFLYTAPIFAALGLHLRLPAERLNRRQWAGVTLAFAGLATAFLLRDVTERRELRAIMAGDLLALLAGLAWGATTVAVRTTALSSLPATQTLLYQLVTGFLLIVPAAWLTGEARFHASTATWASLAFNAIVVSFASFLLWFRLLRTYLASRLGVFSFMTPVFGVILGAWLLNEPITPGFLAGAFGVFAGVAMVLARGGTLPKPRTA